MTNALGGKVAGVFNASARVRVSGGGQRACARRLPVRASPFPYSVVASARPLVDSLDAISVFEVAVVDNSAHVTEPTKL